MHIHTYIHTYIHIYIYTHTHTYIHTNINPCINQFEYVQHYWESFAANACYASKMGYALLLFIFHRSMHNDYADFFGKSGIFLPHFLKVFDKCNVRFFSSFLFLFCFLCFCLWFLSLFLFFVFVFCFILFFFWSCLVFCFCSVLFCFGLFCLFCLFCLFLFVCLSARLSPYEPIMRYTCV
jgi:hypothetical protein